MPLHIPTFLTRTASAIVFAAIMLTGLLWTQMAFLMLVCVIQVLCLNEYFNLLKKITPAEYWPKWLSILLQIIGLLPYVYILLVYEKCLVDNNGMTLMLGIIMILPVSLFAVTTLSKNTSFTVVIQSLAGLLYVVLPVFMFLCLYSINPIIPLVVVLMMWINDTMAYIVGSFIGKTLLTEISPKKTWEGTLGGILLTIGITAIWAFMSVKAGEVNSDIGLLSYQGSKYTGMFWIGVAILASIGGTIGDLFESKLKRNAGVKDSGKLMPGHGGALDRFDSLLFAAPLVFCFTFLLQYFLQGQYNQY